MIVKRTLTTYGAFFNLNPHPVLLFVTLSLGRYRGAQVVTPAGRTVAETDAPGIAVQGEDVGDGVFRASLRGPAALGGSFAKEIGVVGWCKLPS